MDGTDESFRLALQSHARHGTTRLAATTTVARHDQILATLDLTRKFRNEPEPNGSRVLGAHFYGPYFRKEAKGAHPGAAGGSPLQAEAGQLGADRGDAPQGRAPQSLAASTSVGCQPLSCRPPNVG